MHNLIESPNKSVSPPISDDLLTAEQYIERVKIKVVDRIYRRGSEKFKPSEAPGASVNQRADESLLRRMIPEAGKAEKAGTVNLTQINIHFNTAPPLVVDNSDSATDSSVDKQRP